MRPKLLILVLAVMLSACSSHSAENSKNSAQTQNQSAASTQAPAAALRMFIPTGENSKEYLRGYHWLNFSAAQKMGVVEAARTGAVQQMSAVMSLPAEIYVRELDRLFATNSSIQQMEVGQAIQGIAISLKDWNDGSR